MNSFYTEYRNGVRCEEGLPQTLLELRNRGYRLGVIFNSRLYDEVMVKCFARAGLAEYIKTFTFSYYLGIAKPRLEIFEAAKMSVGKADVTMVGDSLRSDIEPAQALGWRGVWLNREQKHNDTDVSPHAEIRSLKDLPDLGVMC